MGLSRRGCSSMPGVLRALIDDIEPHWIENRDESGLDPVPPAFLIHHHAHPKPNRPTHNPPFLVAPLLPATVTGAHKDE